MAARNQRKVKRSGDRQAIVRGFGAREWYDLPDWARVWLADVAGWIALIFALVLAPATLLAIVLGAHALPFEFLGIPGTANGVGLAAIAVIFQFIVLALSVRPLMDKRRRGWLWFIAAAVVHLIQSVLLSHAITGSLELLVVVYLYWQVRPRYK